jgi:hypothetical protein
MIERPEFRSQYRFPPPPEVIKAELLRLEAKYGGTLRAEDVLEEAMAEDSVLHPCFEWDVKVAARAHWMDTARELIRCIEIVRVDEKTGAEVQPRELLFMSAGAQNGGGYTRTAKILTDEERRIFQVREGYRELMGWCRRYRPFREFAKVIKAADAFEVPDEP